MTAVTAVQTWCLAMACLWQWSNTQASWSPRPIWTKVWGSHAQHHHDSNWPTSGGSTTTTTTVVLAEAGHTDDDDDDDSDERYSRQVYTLGTRAHRLIRSSTVFLDGPTHSGLVYETAKNLALLGVRRIVVVTSDEPNDRQFHKAALDDLGAAYERGARAEVGDVDLLLLLAEYIQRLNPSVQVSTMERHTLARTVPEALSEGRVALVAMDRPYSTQVALNNVARELGMAFLSIETAGVFGRLFCDFGNEFEVFDADGETPLITPVDRMEQHDEELFVVHTIEGEKHDVSKGDTIQFQLRGGTVVDAVATVVEVQTPFRFLVKLESHGGGGVQMINSSAASFQRLKIPQLLSFEPLSVAAQRAKTDSTVFTASDLDKSFDDVRRNALFSCFQALSEYVKDTGRFPTASDSSDFGTYCGVWDGELAAETPLVCLHFVRTCAAKLAPLQCVFAALGAQETLKALTGLYHPTHQFLLYDCDEILADQCDEDELSTRASGDAAVIAPGLRYILGSAVVNKLQSQQIFVVGAGAIGCEILKNLATMGVGCLPGGRICLTDMDTIEKSNLSRQLLFRDADVGKFKSAAAHEAVLRFQPKLNIESHSSKVGEGESTPFDDSFWSSKVDVVLNALDNVEARLFMDQQCVAHTKALVDAGTLGPKGNVQVVVPHQSESYASSADPPEPAIPICTLKSFPYVIAHTIQWARDLFDGLFARRPKQANDFLQSLKSGSLDDLAARLVSEKGDEAALEMALELKQDLEGVDETRQSALRWATGLAVTLFYGSALKLFNQHPLDSVDEDGKPFWSGTRRPPLALRYKKDLGASIDQAQINDNLVEFVRSAARLRMEMVDPKVESKFSVEEANSVLIAFDDLYARLHDDSDQPVPESVLALLRDVSPINMTFSSVEFEKDVEENGHVAFVNSASNLRAIAYGIPPVDNMETRRVAGNIVPAMVTTTGFVSALSCIEYIKLVQSPSLERYRNAFINLALPFFAFTVPLPAEEIVGLRGKRYTLWDRLTMKEGKKAATAGGLTLKALIRQIKKSVSDVPGEIAVTSVSFGPYLLFADFLHAEDDTVLGLSLWDLVADALSTEHAESDSRVLGVPKMSKGVSQLTFVDLTVAVEDLVEGQEVELPPVRVERFRLSSLRPME